MWLELRWVSVKIHSQRQVMGVAYFRSQQFFLIGNRLACCSCILISLGQKKILWKPAESWIILICLLLFFSNDQLKKKKTWMSQILFRGKFMQIDFVHGENLVGRISLMLHDRYEYSFFFNLQSVNVSSVVQFFRF